MNTSGKKKGVGGRERERKKEKKNVFISRE